MLWNETNEREFNFPFVGKVFKFLDTSDDSKKSPCSKNECSTSTFPCSKNQCSTFTLPLLINKFISSVFVGFVFSHAMYLLQNSFCFTSIDVSCGGTEGFPRTMPRVTSSYAYQRITALKSHKNSQYDILACKNSGEKFIWYFF